MLMQKWLLSMDEGLADWQTVGSAGSIAGFWHGWQESGTTEKLRIVTEVENCRLLGWRCS